MNKVSLNPAASASSFVAEIFSSGIPGRYDGFPPEVEIVDATLWSCVHNMVSFPHRADSTAIAVPKDPAPITEIFIKDPFADPSFARGQPPSGRCSCGASR